MTFVNEKGGHAVSLTILQTERPEVDCMLRDPILKKAENYAIQLTDFVLSTLPKINPHIHAPFLELIPYNETDMAGIYGTNHIFTPVNCTSVLGLYTQLRRFCERFTRMFFAYGLGDGVEVFSTLVPMLTNAERANTPNNFHERHNDEEDGISVSLSSDLRLRIILGQECSQNFFVQLSDYASSIVGLPRQIFYIRHRISGVENIASMQNQTILDDDDEYWDDENILSNREVIDEDDSAKMFESEESIKNFDERMSIDLISTFPISRKVCLFNGEHSEEYLLGRFDLSSFRDFRIQNKYGDGVVTNPTLRVSEKHHTTAVNMTSGFPNYESNHFLNGSIQSVNFKVLVRYIDQHKVITRTPLDLDDGYYQIKCLFTKKL